MADVSISAAASNGNNFAKKKKANRVAKLKQCKLDARRDQWLSQAKTSSAKKEEGVVICATPCKPENLGINLPKGENTEMNHFSYIESPSNSHTSSILGCNDSVTHFTGSSRSYSSSSSGQFSCGSLSDEECFDDWEAIADALAASDHKHDDNLKPNSQPISDPSKSDCASKKKAWRADDTFRPQSLPNLLKPNTFPTSSDRYYWQRKNGISHPIPCPICCEELDLTDSSFLPCPCGFHLCLFCHKRIIEGDGRCPGCRTPYIPA
jgi:hypothetical protein